MSRDAGHTTCAIRTIFPLNLNIFFIMLSSPNSQYDGGYSNTGGSNGGYRGNGGTSKQNVAYFYVYRNVNSLIQSFYDADAPTLASCRNLCYHDDQCTYVKNQTGTLCSGRARSLCVVHVFFLLQRMTISVFLSFLCHATN